jgi:glyoxylase-like metal-dependent hydrolase (beta-lactamase superfamily II)
MLQLNPEGCRLVFYVLRHVLRGVQVPWAGGKITNRTSCFLTAKTSFLTLEGTNTWLLCETGSRLCTVIDPGPDDKGNLDKLIDHCKSHGIWPGAIISTHAHQDHEGGAETLSRISGAPVFSAKTRTLSEGFFQPYAGGPSLAVVALPGHSSDSVGILYEADKSLFTGDLCFFLGATFIPFPDGSIAEYFSSLEKLRELVQEYRITKLFPGHGKPISNIDENISQNKNHRLNRLQQIQDYLEYAGLVSVGKLTEVLYPQTPQHLQEALYPHISAHLDYLGAYRI